MWFYLVEFLLFICVVIFKKTCKNFYKNKQKQKQKTIQNKITQGIFYNFFGHFSILLDFIVLSKLCIYFSVQDVKL